MDRQLSEFVSEQLSLMTYSHDGYGLGHLRRSTNIAVRFVQQAPSSSVLMLTGCPPGNPFPLPKGIDFIKVPSLIKVDTGVYSPRVFVSVGRRPRRSVLLLFKVPPFSSSPSFLSLTTFLREPTASFFPLCGC